MTIEHIDTDNCLTWVGGWVQLVNTKINTTHIPFTGQNMWPVCKYQHFTTDALFPTPSSINISRLMLLCSLHPPVPTFHDWCSSVPYTHQYQHLTTDALFPTPTSINISRLMLLCYLHQYQPFHVIAMYLMIINGLMVVTCGVVSCL
jgi:hypothetical protein